MSGKDFHCHLIFLSYLGYSLCPTMGVNSDPRFDFLGSCFFQVSWWDFFSFLLNLYLSCFSLWWNCLVSLTQSRKPCFSPIPGPSPWCPQVHPPSQGFRGRSSEYLSLGAIPAQRMLQWVKSHHSTCKDAVCFSLRIHMENLLVDFQSLNHHCIVRINPP